MSRPPLVAIPGRRSPEAAGHRTPVVSGGRLYADAIQRAGGLPVLVPPTDDVGAVRATIERCDAMVLLGGGDVNPARYGQTERERLYGVDDFLDGFEIAALDTAISVDMPVLAICRGHQVLNVALGGTLIQHIATAADHRDVMHPVSVAAGSRIADAMGTTTPSVHSFHHQAIDVPASDLVVVARADDGTIEAVEHRAKSWVVGVQWHPEDTADADPVNQGLFDELVRRATRR
ncbi:MAG: gamma-glutamyl-gamma-aminobutyrate hydrolase family protein [Ilumatobacteraceae bacterium]